MRIGIDARMLGEGAGIARYLEQLIFHLQQRDPAHEYVLFLTRVNWDLVTIPNPRFTKVLANIDWYTFEEQYAFPRIIRKAKVDLMHFPHFNIPIFYRQPFVVTIHDLTMFHYPRLDASTWGPVVHYIKDKVHRWVIGRAVKNAQHIITTTQFTAQDIVTTCSVLIEKMTVTYQAPFISLPVGGDVSSNDEEGSTKPFIMYVGAAYPHKNVEGLLRIWQQYVSLYGNTHELLLVGKKNYFYTRLITSSLFKNTPCVRYLGFVDDTVLVSLYKRAALYVFPSLYEGFGLSPLEAMMHGVPVVSSSRSCLPEVLGEAALYADPDNISQFVDCIHQGIHDDDVRYSLRQAAKKELLRYSWKDLAKQTEVIYEKYVG